MFERSDKWGSLFNSILFFSYLRTVLFLDLPGYYVRFSRFWVTFGVNYFGFQICAMDAAVDMEEDLKVLMKADPERQESLQTEVIPDPMEGEQTWPTEEELNEANGWYWQTYL